MFHATHTYTVLSDRLSKYLYDERLTQAEFAKKANVGVATVNRCLSPFYVPSTAVYRKIAKAMDVDPDTLAKREKTEEHTHEEEAHGPLSKEQVRQEIDRMDAARAKTPDDFDKFLTEMPKGVTPLLAFYSQQQKLERRGHRELSNFLFGAIWFFIGVASLAWILFAYVAFTSNL